MMGFRRRRSRGRAHAYLLAALVGAALGGATAGWLASRHARMPAAPPPLSHSEAVSETTERAIVAAVDRVGRAVVNIDTTVRLSQEDVPRALRRFLGDDFFRKPLPGKGQGSGILIGADGYVLTNAHVVRNAQTMRVTLRDGRAYRAALVGHDAVADVAVVKVNARDLPAAELGSSRDLPVGAWVIAIGNPYGFQNTVTAGVISAKHRALPAHGDIRLRDMLQTDAAISPGNSGGALVGLDGKVVGIPTAIIGGAQGMGFAIAIERARAVAKRLIAEGDVAQPWIGATCRQLTAALGRSLGIEAREGVVVTAVHPGGPADVAGMRRGDVVRRLGDRPIATTNDLDEVVQETHVGDRLIADLERGGRRSQATLLVAKAPRP